MNEYFQPSSVPSQNSPGTSAVIRAEFTAIGAAFNKLPLLAGKANKLVQVNASGTALVATDILDSLATTTGLSNHEADVSAHGSLGDVVGELNVQTLENKTLVVSDNNIVTAASGNLSSTELNSALAELQGDIDTRSPSTLTVQKTSMSGAALLPTGTTAEQPGVGQFGMLRGNEDTGSLEYFTGTAWGAINGSAVMNEESFTAAEGQTVFVTEAPYTVGVDALSIFINGLEQASSAYTETDNHTVTFSEGLSAGDHVEMRWGTAEYLSETDASLVSYTPAGTGAVTTTVQAKLRESVSVKDFGAVGNGDDNDLEKETAAHVANSSVLYPYQSGESYAGIPTVNNLYGSYENSLFARIQAGLRATPTERAEPVLMIAKYSDATRDVNASEWDSGAIYGQLVKMGGSAYGAAVTGNVRHEFGEGQMIGVHGRGMAYHDKAQVWGGWFYGYVSPAATSGALGCIGVEINMNNDGPDIGWQVDGVIGATRALLVTTADDSGPCTIGVSIQAGNRNQNAPEDGFYTGLLIPRKSIRASSVYTGIGNGEAIRLQGSPLSIRHGGIRFHDDNFHYGISFAETTFTANCAILLGDAQRIVSGTSPGSSKYIEIDGSNAFVNFSNMILRINGTQVVTSRRTGWGVNAGTSTRTGFDTTSVTLPQLAERVKALLDDLKTHGLIGA